MKERRAPLVVIFALFVARGCYNIGVGMQKTAAMIKDDSCNPKKYL